MPPRDDTKKKLLDAAIAFMAAGESPTTRALADRAGVNVAAISYYFQGKDNLLAEAIDQAARGDLELWVAEHLASGTPQERLRLFVSYLARIHRNFHTFAHAQLESVVLKGREERATAFAVCTLRALVAEAHGVPETDHRARVQAASLMASLHYLSIFHSQFEDMTGVPVAGDEDRERYVEALLESFGLGA